jgi:hypothetical protein
MMNPEKQLATETTEATEKNTGAVSRNAFSHDSGDRHAWGYALSLCALCGLKWGFYYE